MGVSVHGQPHCAAPVRAAQPHPLRCIARAPKQDPVVQAKFGFLYDSYKHRFFYWETMEMLRKFLIALIPVRLRL